MIPGWNLGVHATVYKEFKFGWMPANLPRGGKECVMQSITACRQLPDNDHLHHDMPPPNTLGGGRHIMMHKRSLACEALNSTPLLKERSLCLSPTQQTKNFAQGMPINASLSSILWRKPPLHGRDVAVIFCREFLYIREYPKPDN